MKKILSVMLMFILLMSLMIPAYADSEEKVVKAAVSASEVKVKNRMIPAYSDSEVKMVEAAVSASAVKVNTGESVTLSAIVPKQGSSYTDSWLLAEKEQTIINVESDSYVSTAVFTAQEPGIYTIEYNIAMDAGKSGVIFSGKGSVTIEVTGVKTVVGAAIRDLVIKPVYDSDGRLTSYLAVGNKCIVWSNGDIEIIGTIGFFFGLNETSKTIEVTFKVSDVNYKYDVAVSRP